MGWHSGDHLIGPYVLPDRLTGPRYLIFVEQVLPEIIGQRTRYRCDSYFHVVPARWSPHISVFLFGITWMQHVGERWIAVEVQCIGLPDHQTFPVWIISFGGK
ncbi:hypothetical protein TNCV_1252751 [Trichonephila clavipes]|nr:hypothetical protein TNCV_1252751 [Trichonephila clavipes]